MSFPVNQYRVIADEAYTHLQAMLDKQNPFRSFVLEDGIIKDRMKTRTVECVPFSKVKEQMPPEYADLGYGDGVEHLTGALQTCGMDAEKAQDIAYSFYKIIPPWVVLPTRIVELIPSHIQDGVLRLDPDIVKNIQAFADWMESLQAKDPEEPEEVDEATQARRAPLLESRKAFKDAYMLFSDETFERWLAFVKTKPDQTYEKKLSVAMEPITFRVDTDDRMFASCSVFTHDKECLSSTAARPHFPEGYQGFGFGDGVQHCMEYLLKQGLNKAMAGGISGYVYRLVDKCVTLPEEDLDRMVASVKEETMAVPASLILKAQDFAFWLDD